MAQQLVGDQAVEHRKPQAAIKSRGSWSSNPAVLLWGTMVGKKVVMAVTGLVLVGFVVAHMLGNLKIFLGPKAIDTYAAFLREVGEPLLPESVLLWTARIILLVSAVLHIIAAAQLTAMNWAARTQGYEAKRSLASTYASLTMRSSGVIVAVFIVFHLLHLTLGVVGYAPGVFKHLAVYRNLVAGFSVWYVSVFYIVAMAALCLHLDHGVWSMLQTLGLNDAQSTPLFRGLSRGVAIVVFLGFILVPVAVLAGWLR